MSQRQEVTVPIKYGELIVLGYNGFQPSGDEAGSQSHFVLCRRPEANGVKPNTVHMGCSPPAAESISMGDQHSISFTNPDTTVVVEYSPDTHTDMFQIGWSTETPNDFVLTNTVTVDTSSCRITCQRSPPHTAHIYAGGFDSHKNIVLGDESVKWHTPDGQMDGLTSNGVLVMHPLQGFTQDTTPGPWREISVCGNTFTLRETRSNKKPGQRMDDEPRELVDGSLIDLCGVTLLWRTAEGLAHTVTTKTPRRPELDAAGRPWCTLLFKDIPWHSTDDSDSDSSSDSDSDEPVWASLQCGCNRGPGRSEAEREAEAQERQCPVCGVEGPFVPLQLGCEEAVFLDGLCPTHAFVPCGHTCSKMTAVFWSRMGLPGDTSTFPATYPACPFCLQRLSGDTGYIELCTWSFCNLFERNRRSQYFKCIYGNSCGGEGEACTQPSSS